MRTPPPNPLVTREDLQQAFLTLEAPILAAWDDNAAGPNVGSYRARYSLEVCRLETFARYLWGLVPFTAGGGKSKGWSKVLDTIVHGTDPKHPGYWGPVTDTDQRSVEMASLGVALRLCPDQFWKPLSGAQKEQVANWMLPMLDKKLVESNWQFFRLLVTLGFRHIGIAPKNVDEIEQKSIDIIEKLYLSDGWYFDAGHDQRDYYIAMAFQFYSMLLSRLSTEGPVSKRTGDWKQRAEEFGKSFAYWFAADGPAFAFGRSLTYRFAQAGYWGGCALAGIGGYSPGVYKGFLLRNLRWWWKQPFLTADGFISLGYSYPNLNMLEPYNAMGSPYWAFKAFAVLQLPENDPFWTAKEEPLPQLPMRSVQKHSRFIVDRDPDSGHATAHSAGQWHTWAIRSRDAKYAKFAYSTFFGPCVGTNHEWLPGVGSDNTMSIVAGETVPENGELWQNRGLTKNHKIEADHVVSDWETISGVTVRSWIVPCGAWHVRVHQVTTDHTIHVAEGGFAAPDPTVLAQTKTSVCLVGNDNGTTGIADLTANREASINDMEPNVSLYHSEVRGPLLVGKFEAGTHWLATAVLGAAPGSKATWEKAPSVDIKTGKSVSVSWGDQNVSVDLTE